MPPTPIPSAGPPVIALGGRTFTVLFPELTRGLTPEEHQTLRDSLSNHGMFFPILIDEEDNIIDGANRLRVASELGWSLDCIRFQVLGPDDALSPVPADDPPLPTAQRLPLTLEQKQAIAVEVNLARRHLNPDEQIALRQQRIHREVEFRVQGMSYRDIGAQVGVDEKQVRKDLATIADQSAMPTHVRTSDGRSYPAQRRYRSADEDNNDRSDNTDEVPLQEAALAEDPPSGVPPNSAEPIIPLDHCSEQPVKIKPVPCKTAKQRRQHRRQLHKQVGNLSARYGVLFQPQAKVHRLVQELLRLIEPEQPPTRTRDSETPQGSDQRTAASEEATSTQPNTNDLTGTG